ncbi:hypothetical protein JXB41_04965 [Candidatus Woesearchaeota archaeon]|nr:hypothetical protein [Candidatus Woesearchaeota archaeon]
MFIDICFPQDNEEQFIKIAGRLGTKALCFVYESNTDFDVINAKLNKLKFKYYVGITIKNSRDLNKINNNRNIVMTEDNSRSFVETKKINMHYNFENVSKKDFLHYRNSGLNQVLCKVLQEKNKLIGLSFSNILNSSCKPVLFGRYIQNARLLKKYNCKFVIASFASQPYELRSRKALISLGICLNFNLRFVKEAMANLNSFFNKQ